MERVGIELLLPTNLAVNSLKFFNNAFSNTTESILQGASKMYGSVIDSTKAFIHLQKQHLKFSSNLKANLNTYDAIDKSLAKYNALLAKQEIGSKAFLETQKRIAELEAKKNGNKGKEEKESKVDIGGLVRGLAALTGISLLIGSVLNYIPEIGQVFGQIKDTIMQNIMQPIRKFVLPILVKMMNFVRDNRAAFVKIGNVIANVFRAIFSIGTTLVNTLIGGFNKVWTAITGGKASISGFIDYLNLVLLKVFFVFTFISMLLEDVMDVLADAVIWAFKNVIFPIFAEFGRVVSFIASFFVDPMKAIEEFDILTQALAAGGITLLAAALLSALVPAIGAGIAAVTAFTIALLANPITWVVIGVMALVAGIVALIKNWQKITTFVQTFWNKWKKWVLFGIAVFAPFLAIPILLWQNWDVASKFLIGAFDKIGTKMSALFSIVRRRGKGIFDGVFKFGSNLFGSAISEWNAMISRIKSIWNQFVGYVVGIGTSIKNAIEEKLNQWWNEFKQTPIGRAIAKGVEVFSGSSQPVTAPVGGGGGYGGGGSSGSAPVNVQQNFNITGANAGDIANKVSEKQSQGFKDVKNLKDISRGK